MEWKLWLEECLLQELKEVASATEGDNFSLHKYINTHTHMWAFSGNTGLLRQELAPYIAHASPDFVIFCFSLLSVECIFMFLFICESSYMIRFHALSMRCQCMCLSNFERQVCWQAYLRAMGRPSLCSLHWVVSMTRRLQAVMGLLGALCHSFHERFLWLRLTLRYENPAYIAGCQPTSSKPWAQRTWEAQERKSAGDRDSRTCLPGL